MAAEVQPVGERASCAHPVCVPFVLTFGLLFFHHHHHHHLSLNTTTTGTYRPCRAS